MGLGVGKVGRDLDAEEVTWWYREENKKELREKAHSGELGLDSSVSKRSLNTPKQKMTVFELHLQSQASCVAG